MIDYTSRYRIFPHIQEEASGSSYTDEQAQDAVGAMVDSTLVYTDGTPLLSRAALTGDVTASAGSNATTIANDAVTFAKMQNVTGPCVFARETASSGDAAAFPIGTGLSFSGGSLIANGGNSVNHLFGTGDLGDLTISAGTTTPAASSTTFISYNNLTINGTGSLNTLHRILYVKGTLDLSAAPAGAIVNPSENGGNGGNPTRGSLANATILQDYCSFLPYGLGSNSGGLGQTGAGGTASSVTGVAANILGQSGLPGSFGGGAGGAASGAGGSATNFPSWGFGARIAGPIMTVLPGTFKYLPTIDGSGGSIGTTMTGTSGGGGGGGSGAGGLAGAGGGAGGGAGQSVFIFARKIITSSSTTAGCIRALGGNGGNGGNAVNANTGGGGGGGGGCGGFVHIVCYELERSSGGAVANAVSASGGNGGNGGTGLGTGGAGVGGDGHQGGLIIIYEIKTDTLTIVRGSAGTNNSGATGGTGGACLASL